MLLPQNVCLTLMSLCIYIYIYIYIYDDDDEIWYIRHRYKVMTLLVIACKINNTNKIQQPQ